MNRMTEVCASPVQSPPLHNHRQSTTAADNLNIPTSSDIPAAINRERSASTTSRRGYKRNRQSSISSTTTVVENNANGPTNLSGSGNWRGGAAKRTRLPFLLGGNKRDPLNLSALASNTAGSNTPPSATAAVAEVEIVIPKNARDPLNLKSSRTHRKRKRRDSLRIDDATTHDEAMPTSPKSYSDSELNVSGSGDNDKSSRPVTVSSSSRNHSRFNKIVSPVPQPMRMPQKPNAKDTSVKNNTEATFIGSKKQSSVRFRYGNYNRYYGKRLPEKEHDPRLDCLKLEWIEGKTILDIGCNIGSLTLQLASGYRPRRILGIDIDGELIGIARKNIRHYCDRSIEFVGRFPASFQRQYGPLSAPTVSNSGVFPDNVWFLQENYVFESDDELDQVIPEFDVILAFSITKWIHLNWGDEGLKRFFKRVYRHLHPGGLFVLETQDYASYRKRSKITAEIEQNYRRIRMRPDKFADYLIVDVGFKSFELVGIPQTKVKGFQRPIYAFRKMIADDMTKESVERVDASVEQITIDSVDNFDK